MNINKVYAHNQTLSQCDEWISKNLASAQRISSDSNSQAALLAKNDKNAACIGNEICAKLYHLNILSKKYTRYKEQHHTFSCSR